MSSLSITLIDADGGDSIFIESIGNDGRSHYALIDSSDSPYFRPTYFFLKKHFSPESRYPAPDEPLFDFVLLSHAHADHGQGLKSIMREFGTKNFWYPKPGSWAGMTLLIDFANRSDRIGFHQAVDHSKRVPDLGDVSIGILNPVYDFQYSRGEDVSSVVLRLTLGSHTVILPGDSVLGAWLNRLKMSDIRFFKIPRSGITGSHPAISQNDFSRIPEPKTILGISSSDPSAGTDGGIKNLFSHENFVILNTALHSDITYRTDGDKDEVVYLK